MALIPTLIAVACMLMLTAFLCAVETALLASSKARLYQSARAGDPRATVALDLLRQIDEVLVAILILITIVPVASSALVTSAVLQTFGPKAVAWSTAILGLTIIFLAEAFPKAIGTRFPEAIALSCAKPLTWCMKFMVPITFTIKHVNDFLLMLAGLRHAKSPSFNEADIRGAINMGLEHGTLVPTQHRMLDAVLDLNYMSVADVMIHRSAIVAIDVDTPPDTLPEVLGALQHSRVLVYKNQPENLIGIFYLRDYLTALATVPSRAEVRIANHLRPLYYVPETTPLGHQLLEFLKQHRHLALVVDEYGDLQGLITLEDVLEEIVGEITDEHDATPSDEPVKDAAGGIVLRGNTPVRSANRHYEWDLPADSAVTLAGLMIEQLGHLPSQGESLRIGNLLFTVATKRGHRIEKIKIKPAPTS